MELDYTIDTDKDFDQAVSDIIKFTAEKGFRVLHIHDVQATLAEKGLQRGPYKIIEVCNSKLAYKALDFSEMLGLFIPCKINVYTKKNKTIISAMRPTMIGQFFDAEKLREVTGEAETGIRAIVDAAR